MNGAVNPLVAAPLWLVIITMSMAKTLRRESTAFLRAESIGDGLLIPCRA